MFNYNLNQANANPNPNNYCGGYALAAVLNHVGENNLNGVAPMGVYNQIQDAQVNLAVNSAALVQVSLDEIGTAISLPSSIAIAAQQNGFNPTVIYWQDEDQLLEEFQDVLPEEIDRLVAAGINHVNNDGNL